MCATVFVSSGTCPSSSMGRSEAYVDDWYYFKVLLPKCNLPHWHFVLPPFFFFRFDTVMFVHPGVLCFVATHLEICHFAVGTSGVCRLTFIEQKHTFKWFNLYVMRLRTFCPTSWYYLYVPDITWCIPGSVRCGRHLTLPHKVFPGLPFSHIGTHIC